MSAYLYYGNLGTVTLDSGYEDASYPAINVGHRNQNTIYQPGSRTAHYIIIDLGEARSCSHLILANHNMYTELTAGDGIRLLTNDPDDNTWANNIQHIGDADPSYALPAASEEPLWVEAFATNTPAIKRYWKFALRNMTVGAEDVQLGLLVVATQIECAVYYDRPFKRDNYHGLRTWDSSGGQTHSDYLHGLKKAWLLHWPDIDESWKDEFLDFWEQTDGGSIPFVFEDFDANQFLVRATQGSFKITERTDELWNVNLGIEEVF